MIALCALRANAQLECVPPPFMVQFSCSVGSCHVSSWKWFSVGTGVYATYKQPVTCCGQNYGTTEEPYGQCIQTELRNPQTRDRLLELAKSTSLLIADCTGKFLPLEAAINEAQEPLINQRKQNIPQEIP